MPIPLRDSAISPTYDREERSRLAIEQGKYTEERFIKPYKTLLEQWSHHFTL